MLLFWLALSKFSSVCGTNGFSIPILSLACSVPGRVDTMAEIY